MLFGKKKKEAEEKKFCDIVLSKANGMLNIVETEYKQYYIKVTNDALSQNKLPALTVYDQYIKRIPILKQTFAKLLDDILELTKDNTVFYYDRNDKTFIETTPESKISNDIIRTLPALAEYVEVYNSLRKKIYDDLCDFSLVCNVTFRFIFDEEEHPKEHKKCMRFLCDNYDGFMQSAVWNYITDEYPRYNTTDFREKFINITHENSEIFTRWRNLWYDNMREISLPYLAAQVDLFKFFESLEETHQSFINSMRQPFYLFGTCLPYHEWSSALNLHYTQLTKDECCRIYQLYLDGTITGEYIKYHDPKYK